MTTKQRNKNEWQVRDIFVSIIVGVFVYLLVYLPLRASSLIHSYFVNYIAASTGIAAAIYLLNQKYPLILFPRLTLRHIVRYILPAIIIIILFESFLFLNWLPDSKGIPEQYNLFIEFDVIGKVFFLFFTILLAPIMEEIFFRGFLYRIVKNRFNIFWGTIVSSGFFYLAHGIVTSFTVLISSLLYTYVYEKTGNIWSSIITHSLNNILVLIFLYMTAK